jgi:hypothetical protein
MSLLRHRRGGIWPDYRFDHFNQMHSMQKKLFALALGALLFGGSLAAVAATQNEPTRQQSCCDGNSACCNHGGEPCCDHCPNKG